MVGFKKASKHKQKLRLAIAGPAGSGKTMTSLKLAQVLAIGVGNGRIGVIDTERGSASLYADKVDFDSIELTHYEPANYVAALAVAAKAGYPVVVVDSFSHAWSGEGGILDQKDAMGGKFDAWRTLTPQHNELVSAMLDYPGHVIATLRSKTHYGVDEIEDGGRKKTKITKLGLAPIQRDGVEYEFTITCDMSLENVLTVSKSRVDTLPPGTVIRKPGESLAKQLLSWLDSGTDAPKPVQKKAAAALVKDLGITEDVKAYCEKKNDGAPIETVEDAERVLAALRAELEMKRKAEAAKSPGHPSGATAHATTTERAPATSQQSASPGSGTESAQTTTTTPTSPKPSIETSATDEMKPAAE